MSSGIPDSVPVVRRGGPASTTGGLSLMFVVVVRPGPDRDGRAVSATVIGLEDLAPIGYLTWHVEDDGEILDLHVREDRRRLGVGRLLWEVGHVVAADRGWPGPRHSQSRTVLGDAWAGAVGGPLPPWKETTDYEAFRAFALNRPPDQSR